MMVNVVGLDLILPAVINEEWNNQKRLSGYSEHKEAYIRGMRFLEQDFIRFVLNMNFKLIGRVTCSFTIEDIRKVLETSGYFITDGSYYALDLSSEMELKSLLTKLKSKMNYDMDVIRAAGLMD